MILAARALLLDSRRWVEGGGLVIRRGRVAAVLRSRRSVLRAGARGRVELDGLVLTPGLVDAHVHLDLGALHALLPRTGGFAGWIRALVRERSRMGARERERALRAGARELLASGTTAVGDVDASGTMARVAGSLGLRALVYREILDAWDPARTAGALHGVRRRLPARALVREGLSPHAPYTTSAGLLALARDLAARRALALTIHWAETREEELWLEHGRGALAALLPASPRSPGLALLERARLLGPRTSLVHGNHPGPGEIELLAARRVSLVHCPGTHAFFARAPFPLERYRAAGVPLALGTDSLASNESLDMRREMALLRAAFPPLDPADVFAMASAGGARALGLAPRVGRLVPGAEADAVAWRLEGRTAREALEELTAGSPRAARVFVAGRERSTAPHPGRRA